ncbi:hypothetical protein GCM10010336_74200 [Streptomyces goshikiensis]|nr:hypothetical protein GCM10010336_74200 [Streptomyces goshikiensis]
MGAELVADLVAIPDGVLLAPGEDGDGLGELAVDGQRPAGIGVGAQDGEKLAAAVFFEVSPDRVRGSDPPASPPIG